MNYSIPYTFGHRKGIHPDDWKTYQDQEAFETFLIKILGSKAYERRKQIRMMESAISHTANSILISQS